MKSISCQQKALIAAAKMFNSHFIAMDYLVQRKSAVLKQLENDLDRRKQTLENDLNLLRQSTLDWEVRSYAQQNLSSARNSFEQARQKLAKAKKHFDDLEAMMGSDEYLDLKQQPEELVQFQLEILNRAIDRRVSGLPNGNGPTGDLMSYRDALLASFP